MSTFYEYAKKNIRIIDPVWEEKYSQGHKEKYPWDVVVGFVFRNMPQNVPRKDINILEVGFGTGNNLYFAAKEGFCVSGIEGSKSAVAQAKSWFEEEKVSGDLRCGDFTKLPFDDDVFDLVIDRAALCCTGKKSQAIAISEINRVLKIGGKFQYNVYADSHSSYRSGKLGVDGVRIDITEGSLTGVGQLHFVSRSEIDELFSAGWVLHQVQRREWVDMLAAKGDTHAEWVVIAEKKVV